MLCSLNQQALIGFRISLIYGFCSSDVRPLIHFCAKINVFSFLILCCPVSGFLGWRIRKACVFGWLLGWPSFHAPHILEMGERVSFCPDQNPFQIHIIHSWVTFHRCSLSKSILTSFLITTFHSFIFLLYERDSLPFTELTALICAYLWIPAYLSIHPHLV